MDEPKAPVKVTPIVIEGFEINAPNVTFQRLQEFVLTMFERLLIQRKERSFLLLDRDKMLNTLTNLRHENGYEVKNLKIEECSGNDGFIKFGNLKPELRDDCTVTVKGCATLTKDLTWGNGTYVAEKKSKLGMPVKFSGEKSMCKLLTDSKDSPEITQALVMINLEQKCPVKAGKICGNSQALNVTKYKEYFKMMGGDYETIVKGRTNAGKACFKASMSVVPKGGKSLGPSMIG